MHSLRISLHCCCLSQLSRLPSSLSGLCWLIETKSFLHCVFFFLCFLSLVGQPYVQRLRCCSLQRSGGGLFSAQRGRRALPIHSVMVVRLLTVAEEAVHTEAEESAVLPLLVLFLLPLWLTRRRQVLHLESLRQSPSSLPPPRPPRRLLPRRS